MNREIRYDRGTRDFACYVDGELIGFAKNYHAGEVLCDQYIFDELARAEPIPSMNEAHRQERWDSLTAHVATLPAHEQKEAVRFAAYVFNRIVGQRSIAAIAA